MGIHRVARILAPCLPRLQVARRPVTIAVAVSVLAGSFQGVPTPSAWRGQVSKSARPLLGDWVLNRDASDDPTPRPLVGDRGNQSRRSRPGGFGISGFGFGRSGRARGRDQEQKTERRTAAASEIRDLMTAPRRLTIAETRRGLRLTYGDGRVVRLNPDGREHAGLAGTSGQVTRRSWWEAERLVAQIELETRPKLHLVQFYDVQDGKFGLQLVVTSHFDGGPGGGEDREFRYIYDADPR